MLQARPCPGIESKQMQSACGLYRQRQFGKGMWAQHYTPVSGNLALLLLEDGEKGQWELEDAVSKMKKPPQKEGLDVRGPSHCSSEGGDGQVWVTPIGDLCEWW